MALFKTWKTMNKNNNAVKKEKKGRLKKGKNGIFGEQKKIMRKMLEAIQIICDTLKEWSRQSVI
jgi:hypothetical protein